MSLRSEVVRIFNELVSGGKKITSLPAAASITGTELIEAVQNGANVKVIVSAISGGSSFTLTDGNGTEANGTAVDLGGTLTGNTDIAGDGNTLNLGTSGDRLFNFNVYAQDQINISSSASGIVLSGLSGISSAQKHTFSPSATLAPINLGSLAGDPSAPVDGDIWHNSTTDHVYVRVNGVTYQLDQQGGVSDWGDIGGTLSDQTDLQTALDLKHNLYLTHNRQTGSYVLVLTDKDSKLIEMDVASGNSVTVPLNSSVAFPIGSVINIVQYGVGLTTIIATGGVTIRSSSGVLTVPSQYASITLEKIGTDEWYLWNGTPGTTAAALTKTDDTNVTATLTGSPTTALLNASNIALGWTGQLSTARGGTGSSVGAWLLGGTSPLSSAVTVTGTNSLTFTNNPAVSSTFARSIHINPSLTALANADQLISLDVQGTYNFGGFTGLVLPQLRVGANASATSVGIFSVYTHQSGTNVPNQNVLMTNNSAGDVLRISNANGFSIRTIGAGASSTFGVNESGAGFFTRNVCVGTATVGTIYGYLMSTALTASGAAYNFLANSVLTTGATSNTLYNFLNNGTYTINHTGASLYAFRYLPTINGSQTLAFNYGVVIEPTAALNGFGLAAPTATMHVVGTTKLDGSVTLPTAGNGILIKEGTNATSGVATLVGGTVTVNTTKTSANSRIHLTVQGGTLTNVGSTYISARSAGTSFTISSTNILDAADVAWIIIEPAP